MKVTAVETRPVLEFKDGNAIVPERPGWGFTFNHDTIRHLGE